MVEEMVQGDCSTVKWSWGREGLFKGELRQYFWVDRRIRYQKRYLPQSNIQHTLILIATLLIWACISFKASWLKNGCVYRFVFNNIKCFIL